MSKNKIDLNKLKNEIAKEKQSKNTIPSYLGESVGVGVAPRDEFLHGLVTSLTTGKATPASNLIKIVENTVSQKHDKVATHKINETVSQPRKKIEMSPERDEQLFADIEAKGKQTLAESIEKFSNTQSTTPVSPTINYNGQQLLTSIPATAQPTTTQSVQINESALLESVKQIVNTHLTENLAPIFEEAIKGTIIEMYAIERIKDVLNENRDLIKKVVIETIKEIQAKNKAKKTIS